MNKYLIAVIVMFFGGISIAVAQDSFPQGQFKNLQKTGQATAERIIDPLTIALNDGRLVRLSGIEIPDFRPLEPGDITLTALSVLDDLLNAQSITLYQTKKKDEGRLNRMGHSLAHIQRTHDQAWAQGTLLRLGLARVQTTARNPEMAAQMLALETAARDEKLGLWADTKYNVRTPETASDHINSFQIVEGKVHSAALKNNRIYLNFGPDWRSDFTVSIPANAKRLFSKAGQDPLTWGEKRIRVRGWLEEYNGPSLIANHPEVIELLP